MGNLCSKSDKDENFSSPGRVLGSTPEQPARASVPKSKKTTTVGGPARTLGGSSGAASNNPNAESAPGEARSKAAEAAEVSSICASFTKGDEMADDRQARAKAASKSSGKLSSQLNAQKKQTRNETLKEASRDELRARDADENAEARRHE
jgi:hypothetical protein